MALNRIVYPTTPDPVTGDWALINALMTKTFQNMYSPIQLLTGNFMPQGVVVQIGGIIYFGTTDTAITGTPSDYVKFTPNAGDSGATCDVAYVADLTGVTWNKLYSGYYDVSENLYTFDEVSAYLAGDLTTMYTKFGDLWLEHVHTQLDSGYINMYDGTTDADRIIDFASDASLLWDESADKFVLNKDLSFYDQTTDADGNIEFASDADILWDESEDGFYFNKRIRPSGLIFGTTVTAGTTVICGNSNDYNTTLSGAIQIRSGDTTSYVFVHEYTVLVKGTIRAACEFSSFNTTDDSFVDVRKNGVSQGTTTNKNGTFGSYTDDIVVVPGDTISWWVKNDATGYTKIRKLEISIGSGMTALEIDTHRALTYNPIAGNNLYNS